jgi:hypothetical protein
LHVALERSTGASDLDVAIDRAGASLDLDFALDRTPARAGDRRVSFHGLARGRIFDEKTCEGHDEYRCAYPYFAHGTPSLLSVISTRNARTSREFDLNVQLVDKKRYRSPEDLGGRDCDDLPPACEDQILSPMP